MAVDQVEALGLGEFEGRLGEAVVGKHDQDVAAVYLAACAVEDIEIGHADC